jgi:hypothetical protein
MKGLMNLNTRLLSPGAVVAVLIGMTVAACPTWAGTEKGDPDTAWPPIRLGMWKLETTHTSPGGKTKRWSESARACSDAGGIFIGYWGGGVVQMAGCRYQPEKVGKDHFRIATECVIRGGIPSNGTMEVTMHGEDAFEMEGTVTEGKKTYHLKQLGHRLSDCPAVPSGQRTKP